MNDKNHFDQKDTGVKYLTAAFIAISFSVGTFAYKVENGDFDKVEVTTPKPVLGSNLSLSN